MSREAILGAIRRGLKRGPLQADQAMALTARLAGHPRHLIPARSRGTRPVQIALFIANIEREFGSVARVPEPAAVPGAVAAYLTAQNLPTEMAMSPHPELQAMPWREWPLLHIREGRAEGRLLGGCLSILAEGLGTPWALRVEEPCVLFLEDIGTKPYQWDRMLQHLKFAGLMERVTGVVLGDMTANVGVSEMELLESACLHALRDFEGPVTIGLRSGHVASGNRSLPLGAWVKMDGSNLVAI